MKDIYWDERKRAQRLRRQLALAALMLAFIVLMSMQWPV